MWIKTKQDTLVNLDALTHILLGIGTEKDIGYYICFYQGDACVRTSQYSSPAEALADYDDLCSLLGITK